MSGVIMKSIAPIADLALSLTVVLVAGLALSLTWNWFAVPAFAVPMITPAQAIGIKFVFKIIEGPKSAGDAVKESKYFAAADESVRSLATTTVTLAAYAAILAVAAIYNAIV